MQAPYDMRPPVDRYSPVFGNYQRMVVFLLCNRADLVSKVQGLHEILKLENPF